MAKKRLSRAARRRAAKYREIAEHARMFGDAPTYEEILAARTGPGGWKRAKLAEWGVDWPPYAGWIDDLIRKREFQHAQNF